MLLVDDEPSLRLLCRVNLLLAGFEVHEAEDGESALELARREPFDLFLLDVMMAGIDGFELARRLREDERTAGTPILFISARADRADIERGLALGAADYITKPFDPLTLGARLAKSVGRNGA